MSLEKVILYEMVEGLNRKKPQREAAERANAQDFGQEEPLTKNEKLVAKWLETGDKPKETTAYDAILRPIPPDGQNIDRGHRDAQAQE